MTWNIISLKLSAVDWDCCVQIQQVYFSQGLFYEIPTWKAHGFKYLGGPEGHKTNWIKLVSPEPTEGRHLSSRIAHWKKTKKNKPCAAGFEIYILCWTIERCMALRSEMIGVWRSFGWWSTWYLEMVDQKYRFKRSEISSFFHGIKLLKGMLYTTIGYNWT